MLTAFVDTWVHPQFLCGMEEGFFFWGASFKKKKWRIYQLQWKKNSEQTWTATTWDEYIPTSRRRRLVVCNTSARATGKHTKASGTSIPISRLRVTSRHYCAALRNRNPKWNLHGISQNCECSCNALMNAHVSTRWAVLPHGAYEKDFCLGGI